MKAGLGIKKSPQKVQDIINSCLFKLREDDKNCPCDFFKFMNIGKMLF